MTSAPPPPPAAAGGQPPNNNLVFGILTTLLCCLPLGIVSIVKAASVNGLWQSGDVAGAQKAAEDAKKFAMWGAIIGGVFIVLYLVLVVFTGAMTFSTF